MNRVQFDDSRWDTVIVPKVSLFDFNFREIWEYRDLLFILVKRDIITIYKQTVLGPIWFFLSPLMTVAVFTFVFSSIARISTNGIPAPLFYLAGTTCWNYFQACFTGTSSTFVANAAIFGKVYFPRLISPLSLVISNLIKFGIQLLIFSVFLVYYTYQGAVAPNFHLFLFPVLILLMGGIALGLGILFSALTTKYRDLSYFISFGVSILMYATPVIYPSSAIPTQYSWLIEINPIAPIIETFRYSTTGYGNLSWGGLGYSTLFMAVCLLVGIVTFNRVERTFMDTV
jgi:lipopolysaccharide transport system permease protein